MSDSAPTAPALNEPVIIEVCTGPNCSAGGAAILEIEELILEDGTGGFRIISGGCRDLCSMGPNVHCQSTHFPRIRSPEDCYQLALQVGMQVLELPDTEHDEGGTSSRIGSMLWKKASRLRWKVLRDIGNRKAGVSQCKAEEWQQRLQEAYRIEESAARSFGCTIVGVNRAAQRLDRLEAMIIMRMGEK